MLGTASPLASPLVAFAERLSRPMRSEAVCMLHVGRVGSTVLADMLGQSPDVISYGEIWEPAHNKILETTNFAGFHPDPDPFFPLKRALARSGRATALFEIKFLQAHHMKMLGVTLEEFVQIVAGFGVRKFIILERRNLLRRALSGELLRESKVSHVKKGETTIPVKKHFDVEHIPLGEFHLPLDRFFAEIREGYAAARSATSEYPTLNLVYEDDLMNDLTVGYKKCCDFMDLKAIHVEQRLGRTNPFPVIDMVENVEALEAKLRPGGDEWMLNAD